MPAPRPLSVVSFILVCGLFACGDDPAVSPDTNAPDTIDTVDPDVTPADVADLEDTPADVNPDTSAPAPALRHHRTFEATLPLAVPDGNPFDPREIAVDCTFTDPDGPSVTTPAFVYAPFTRALDNDRERLTAAGPREWRVRFRPPAVAEATALKTWTWSCRVVTPTSDTTTDVATFTAEPAAAGHGVLRVSREDPRFLAFEDGAPYFAIGENLAWADVRGTFAYDQWMGELADHGGNYIRLWMPSWGMGLEWTSPPAVLGDYGPRLDRAWQLDHVLALAESRGIYAMLTLQNHGPFSFQHAGQWEDNPYNADNGGPLTTPTAFFTDSEARRLFRQRLRYIVARWGHSPQVLAWELWNEVDLVMDPTAPEVAAWTAEMAGVLRELDVHDHLVTTSLGGVDVLTAYYDDTLPALTERMAFWAQDAIDLTQIHLYGIGLLPLDFTDAMPAIAGYLHPFGKPVLIAEAGVSAASAEDTLAYDPDGAGFHDILWMGLFAETFGAGMGWWWDSVTHPGQLYRRMAPLAELVAGLPLDRAGLGRLDLVTTPPLFAPAMRGEALTLAWLKNPTHQWYAPDASPIAGATLHLAALDLTPGAWRATFIDPYGATPTSSVTFTAPTPTLALPTFSRDLALRLERVD